MMKILLIGDIGSRDDLHVGDEAMAEAAVAHLAARFSELEVVAVSGFPKATTARYGWPAVERAGFDGLTDAEADARLDSVIAAAKGDSAALAWDDPAWQIIHAMGSVDAALITGGGNLTSTWPHHVYERAAFAQIAKIFERPLVVTGQTVGPQLTARHGELVAGILTSAALVGVRERASHEMARRLGVPSERLVMTLDDAWDLAESPYDVPVDGEYVAATFSPHHGLLDAQAHLDDLSSLVDSVVRITGRDVVLVPHVGATGSGPAKGDVELHARLKEASAYPDRLHCLPVLSSQQVAHVTRRSELVVSSRYHPVVFALPAGVPAVGLAVDAYTSTKIVGTAAEWGVSDYIISAASMATGGAERVVAQAWDHRSKLARHLADQRADKERHSARWWSAVAESLEGSAALSVPSLDDAPRYEEPEWCTLERGLRDFCDTVSIQEGATRLATQADREETVRLRSLLLSQERVIAGLKDDIDHMFSERADLQASLERAHARVARKMELRRAASVRPSADTEELAAAELQALLNTRTFRWSRPARSAWGAVRSRFVHSR
jgi:polysaccharide pyruvyl transferase WcaK-like protein